MKEKIRNNKVYYFFKIVITTIFAFTLFLDSLIVFNGDIFAKSNEVYFSKIKLINVTILIVSWLVTFGIITLIEKIIDKLENKEYKEKKKRNIFMYIVFLIILLVCWIPYVLSYFPGGIYSDTGSTIDQALGNVKLNNHHPILYALLFRVFLTIGNKFNGGTQLGVEIFTVFQVVLMAMVCAYFIYWLYKKEISSKCIILSTMFFGICRLIPIYAISLWKDVPFCLALFMYIICVAEIIYNDGKNLRKIWPVIYYNVLLILVAFLRNNGKYIVVITTIALLILYRKEIIKHLKKFTIISMISIILTFVIQGPVYNKMNMNTEFTENIGVLLQQIFSVVVKDKEITDEQREFINQICPIEIIKQKYSPCIVDKVKWDPNFNNQYIVDNKTEFFKIWLELGIKYPKTYIGEYLLNTMGFWDINKATMDAYMNPRMWENSDLFAGVYQTDYIEKTTGKTIRNIIEPKVPVSSAIYLFVLLFGALFTIYKKQYKNLLIYIPAFSVWATIMIAVPLAFSLRYVYILLLTIPLNVVVPFLKVKK